MPAADLSVAERLERMYGEVSDTAHYTASDRIGRNYSRRAAGLTMRNIRARSKMDTQRGLKHVGRARLPGHALSMAPASQLTRFPQASSSMLSTLSPQRSVLSNATRSPGLSTAPESPGGGGFDSLVDERTIALRAVRTTPRHSAACCGAVPIDLPCAPPSLPSVTVIAAPQAQGHL